MDFNNKHVLVTGGGSGIGLAITEAMVAAGARVTITGRDPAKLDALARHQPAITGRVCDVTDDDAVIALRDELMAAGGIDILVNNAGVMDFFHILEGHPLVKQIKEIDIDAVGPLRMIHHFLPSLLKREATIINVSSGLAYLPYCKAPVYSAAKSFVHVYTQCLREQLRGTSVRVVELLPPVVDTPMAAGVKFPLPPMPPEKLVAALMRGLRRGQTEIAPGISILLKWMGRLLPQFGFRQMSKS
jgi:uncharacterized oxidoreductase